MGLGGLIAKVGGKVLTGLFSKGLAKGAEHGAVHVAQQTMGKRAAKFAAGMALKGAAGGVATHMLFGKKKGGNDQQDPNAQYDDQGDQQQPSGGKHHKKHKGLLGGIGSLFKGMMKMVGIAAILGIVVSLFKGMFGGGSGGAGGGLLKGLGETAAIAGGAGLASHMAHKHKFAAGLAGAAVTGLAIHGLKKGSLKNQFTQSAAYPAAGGLSADHGFAAVQQHYNATHAKPAVPKA